MLAKLFAFFGLKRARRWDAQAEAVRLASLLEYLEAADVALEEMEYAFIEKFYSETMRAEYQKELRALRRKFGIRGCKLGLIDCAERGDGLMTEQFLAWKEDERQRGGRKRKTAEPMEFTPGRKFDDSTTEPNA
jgi:hypothetical protein